MSSSKAQVNITALAEFGNSLKGFSDKLEQSISDINLSLKRLESEWKDPKFKEFSDEFSKCTKDIQPLSDEFKRYKRHFETHWIPKIEIFIKRRAN